jgi:beta-lactamase class A
MPNAQPWRRVEEVVAEVSRYGLAGVSIIGPDGATWQQFGDRKFNPASTLKIPVMVEIHRKIDAGALSLDDVWTLTDDDRVGGSGVLNQMRTGAKITLYDLLYLMISISDNLATDVLINKAGLEAINRTMADLGMKNSRLVSTIRSHFEELRNPAVMPTELGAASPNDYAGAIAAILDGEAASAASCTAMTELLEKQQNHRRIARYLPQMFLSAGIRFGSKTGTMRGVCNEAGFIMSQNGRLIIAVYTEGYSDTNTAEKVIGEIARAAMADTGVVGPVYPDQGL